MKETILSALQILLASVMCAIIGTPQATFTSIQHFMMDEHIYSDRCMITNASSDLPIYCYQSRLAYINVYNAAGLGFAIAIAPAFYSVRLFGYSFTNICCCLILAAGSVFIADTPEDPWVTDRFIYGYGLISMSAPFAILNAFRAISYAPCSEIVRLLLVAFVLAALQLGPLVSTFLSSQFLKNDLSIGDLFRNLLWLPYIWLLVTLLIMPLSDSNQALKPNVLAKKLKAYFNLRGNYRRRPVPYGSVLDEHSEYLNDASELNQKPTYMRAVFSRTFLVLFLAYVANSLPLDLMFVGGEAHTKFHEELLVWTELTIISPIVAGASILFIFWLTTYLGVRLTTSLTCALSIIQTLCQYWSVQMTWIVSSAMAGTCQALLIWTTALCFVKCIRAELFGLTSLIFIIGSVIVKFFLLPYIDIAVEFDQVIYGHNPYKLVMAFQGVTSIALWIVLNIELQYEDRFYLELEARTAFAHELYA